MAQSLRLQARQTQSLTLTPQLMQSIKLLQLSHQQLAEFVEAELLRNPLLEHDEKSDDEVTGPDAGEPVHESEAAAPPDAFESGERNRSAETIAETMDTELAEVFPEQVGSDAGGGPWPERSGGRFDAEPVDLDQFVSARQTLTDHLTAQVALILRDPAERLIARHLIANLDEAGYLAADTDTIADQLGAAPTAVEAVLAKVRGCEPVGVFARSVSECLAIQLAEQDRLDPMMRALLDNLELVAGHDLDALGRAIGAEADDIDDMLDEIRHLDPRPGLAFEGEPVQAVVPDVFVRPANDGGWLVELNSDILPRVLVNRAYYATVSKRTRDAGEKRFLSDCLQSANWLTKSLDQRAQTTLKVTTEIVRQQDGFLSHGIAHLKPMTLRMVADAIGMHESTVSRVTANKYVATPRGVFELKYFFTTALASSAGDEAHSAEAVRHRIRQLIEAEDPRDILSDDALAAALHREQGIEIARRTVAKYREAMGIPSSVVRRRQKRAAEIARHKEKA
jgi:RNA polymerase sigma-54 factor